MKKYVPRANVLRILIETRPVFMELFNYCTFETFNSELMSIYRKNNKSFDLITCCRFGNFDLNNGIRLNVDKLNLVCVGYFYFK